MLETICPCVLQAAHELFGMGRESIDLTFGGVTIGTAVVATLVGGWALDWVGSSIKNAMLLNGTTLLLLACCTLPCARLLLDWLLTVTWIRIRSLTYLHSLADWLLDAK